MRPIKSVWLITREYRGFADAGGVKDVSRDLSEALAGSGYSVTVVMPLYGFMDPETLGLESLEPVFEVDMNYSSEERREQIGFCFRQLNGVRLVLVRAERFSEKMGVYTYTESEEILNPDHKMGTGHYDYFAMNLLLQKAALGFAAYTGERPDVFHCQDGHAALLPALMRELEGFRQYFSASSALVTIHNAGTGYHQEVGDLAFARAVTGLPLRVILSNLLNGAFDPLLAGAAYAVVNTVSENYAKELQETELDALTGWFGHALKDRGISLMGITNGINPDAYDPRKPEKLGLPAAFDPEQGDLRGKTVCRKRLCSMKFPADRDGARKCGRLDFRPDQPLVTVISRITEQKGLDVLAVALEELMAVDDEFQVALLGSGNEDISRQLACLAEDPGFDGRMAVYEGYDPVLANYIYASGDFFVVPSRYEPCGLTDFIAQLMGNVPVVRATGGLVKVKDGFNGFTYREHTPEALSEALVRALEVYRKRPGVLGEIRVNAIRNIRKNYTWDRVMEKYVSLYRKAMETVPGQRAVIESVGMGRSGIVR
ncbi:MAG TPA: glycogen synthase [Thermodesulfobacteriaceae bacterium]|nr:glycogen synthase [Thermodesulfobacteriaceae bacterium]